MSHTLAQAIQHFASLPVQLQQMGEAASLEVAQRVALPAAIDASSGDITTAQLRREDHPYAKRHGAPRRDPSRINTQTGSFRSMWRAVGTAIGGQVLNDSRVADWLEQGTDTMFARPVLARVVDRLDSDAEMALSMAMHRPLTLFFS